MADCSLCSSNWNIPGSNLHSEVSLCFCVTRNHCVPILEIMLMFLLPAAVDHLIHVCWHLPCVMLRESLQNIAAGSELSEPANNSKIRVSGLCSQLSAQDWCFFSWCCLPSLHVYLRCLWKRPSISAVKSRGCYLILQRLASLCHCCVPGQESHVLKLPSWYLNSG